MRIVVSRVGWKTEVFFPSENKTLEWNTVDMRTIMDKLHKRVLEKNLGSKELILCCKGFLPAELDDGIKSFHLFPNARMRIIEI